MFTKAEIKKLRKINFTLKEMNSPEARKAAEKGEAEGFRDVIK